MLYSSESAFTTWDTTDPAALELLSAEVFELEEPGADPERQEAPHPHQAITDPTGKFVLVPDLGADLVRIWATSEDDLSVTTVEPLSVPAGSGPRHGAFAVIEDTTYFYVVTELGNTILGYTVTYGEGSLSFEQIYESGSHGEGAEVPESAGAAEIWVSVSPYQCLEPQKVTKRLTVQFLVRPEVPHRLLAQRVHLRDPQLRPHQQHRHRIRHSDQLLHRCRDGWPDCPAGGSLWWTFPAPVLSEQGGHAGCRWAAVGWSGCAD